MKTVLVQLEANGLNGDTVAARDLIELRLRSSGVRVVDPESREHVDGVIVLSLLSWGDPGDKYIFGDATVSVYRTAYVEPKSGSPGVQAIIWQSGFLGATSWDRFRPELDSVMDRLLNAWFKANPKA